MQFFPERKVNEIMAKTSVEWYLDAVDRALICSRKVKKRVISQLSDDICGLEEEYGHELSREEIEAQFGSPEEAAKGFLKVTEIRKKVSAKRIIVIFLVVMCAVIIGYVGYEFIQERKLRTDMRLKRRYTILKKCQAKLPIHRKMLRCIEYFGGSSYEKISNKSYGQSVLCSTSVLVLNISSKRADRS